MTAIVQVRCLRTPGLVGPEAVAILSIPMIIRVIWIVRGEWTIHDESDQMTTVATPAAFTRTRRYEAVSYRGGTHVMAFAHAKFLT